MNRDHSLATLNSGEVFDFLVIGGGATGSSIALDAASRGYRVALIEQSDFGKGTSSRSTKLVHGGVRYLAQGQISLVRGALHERTLLRNNAPSIVHELRFLVPCQSLLQYLWYRTGFWIYDWLAGNSGFAGTAGLSQQQCLQHVPTIRNERARRGILYSDGQFDDTRLLIAFLQTATERGAAIANYVCAEQLIFNDQQIVSGVVARDLETDQSFPINARVVINATGPFCDHVRQLANPDEKPLIAASQGVHIVLPKKFLPGSTAIIVPKTSDGRVLFLIPWLNHVLVGTTDTPIDQPTLEPLAQAAEIDFILQTTAEYLKMPVKREDVLSVFTGIRPLVRSGSAKNTAALSRDHTIEISSQRLVTITGGKWTTARKMAEDCVNQAADVGQLPARPCVTESLRLQTPTAFEIDQVSSMVRDEMARSVEDVLARRSRLLFLNARAAIDAAPEVARTMADDLGRDAAWVEQQVDDFKRLAAGYCCPPQSLND